MSLWDQYRDDWGKFGPAISENVFKNISQAPSQGPLMDGKGSC